MHGEVLCATLYLNWFTCLGVCELQNPNNAPNVASGSARPHLASAPPPYLAKQGHDGLPEPVVVDQPRLQAV
jgi:hypothetical protein